MASQVEIPLHPTLSLARQYIEGVDSSAKKEKARDIFTAINTQLVENWTTQPVSEKKARLPYTSFSTKQLPEFPASTTKKLYIALPGTFGQTGDRLNQLLPLVFSEYAEEAPAQTEFVLIGYPTSFGGKVTKEWCSALQQEGPALHGHAVAEIVSQFIQEPREALIFDGRSKGAITAGHAIQAFPEYRGKRTLIRDHQPGAFLKTILGYPVDTGIGRIKQLFAKNHYPEHSEVQFLQENTELSASDSMQRRLQKRAFCLDVLQLNGQSPIIPDDVTVLSYRGFFDLTDFSFSNLLRHAREKKDYQGQTTTVFDLSMHTERLFPRRIVKQMIEAIP